MSVFNGLVHYALSGSFINAVIRFSLLLTKPRNRHLPFSDPNTASSNLLPPEPRGKGYKA